MFFGIALSIVDDENHAVNSNFFHGNRRDDTAYSSSISTKGSDFLPLSSSNKSKARESLTSKRIAHVIRSREIQNSLLDKKDYKDKIVILDDSSTADSKTFEVCKNLGVVGSSCSSKEDVCVPLSEQKLSFLLDDMVTELTDGEMRELGVCLDLSLIEAIDLFHHSSDASAAAVANDEGDEGTHLLSSASGQDLVYASYASSLSIKEEDNDRDHRQLEEYFSFMNCTDVCGGDRPEVDVTGEEFRSLVYDCIGSITSNCPEGFNDVPLNCWNTSNVDSMSKALYDQYNFNDPLECWDTWKVTDMSFMFYYAPDFNQIIASWDVREVKDMQSMFYDAYEFNQPLESWDVIKVTDMNKMFSYAFDFNQCLSTWAGKTGAIVNTTNMFLTSGCPIQSDPEANVSPWCQGDDVCFTPQPSESPSTSPSAGPSIGPSVGLTSSPSAGPTSSHSPTASPDGPCTNSDGTVKLSKKKTTTCAELKKGSGKKKKKSCKNNAVLKACPGICNDKCTCKDKTKFKLKATGKKKYQCKNVGKDGQPECSGEVNKPTLVEDVCPKKCDVCFE